MARFWLTWTLGGTLAFAAAVITLFMAIGAVSDGGPEAVGIPFEAAFPMVIGLAASAMAGIQSLTMRRRLAGAARWIPATGLGMAVGLGLVMLLVAVTGEPDTLGGVALNGVLHGVVIGAVVGGAQALVLRDIDSGRRWMVMTVTAMAIASGLGDVAAFYTDGGFGILVTIFLWHGLVARTLYRMVVAPPMTATLSPTTDAAAPMP